MADKSLVVPLGESDQDRYRLDCSVVRRRVTVFRIQYEAYINGEWRAIVRYDTAHGFPHRDMVHPDGREDKTLYPGRTHSEVLTLGQEDIRLNWARYRSHYEKEMSS